MRKDTGQLTGAADDLDFSLLFDGLAAEREQKITIDLAYRFFATEKRKFIVADAPGHEQYTRNMATGASTADLALILVNAQSGLTQQTRRHALIAATLGVRHLVVAVNKMDLVAFSQERLRGDRTRLPLIRRPPRRCLDHLHSGVGAQGRQCRQPLAEHDLVSRADLARQTRNRRRDAARRQSGFPHGGAMGQPADRRISAAIAG